MGSTTKSRRASKLKQVRLAKNAGLPNSKLAQWGNSLGFRIPQQVATQLKLKAGSELSIRVQGGVITIKPTKPTRRKWTEAELLKGVTPKKVGGEFDWGSAVGKEVW